MQKRAAHFMFNSPSLQQRKTWCRGAARRLGILLRVIDPRAPRERDTMLSYYLLGT